MRFYVRSMEGLGGGLLPFMLNVWRHGDPFVLALLIDGHSRCWERWVRERADRDCDQVGLFFQVVVDSRTTDRAKVVRDLVARASSTDVMREVALDNNGLRREASLFSEDAAGPALACEAVPHGVPDPVTCGHHPNLSPATTRAPP